MTKFVEPYNPNWKSAFECLKQFIGTALSDLALDIDIQHIGSTSIPGLFSKPILDIDIIIENKDLLPTIIFMLEKIGYKHKGDQGIPGRFAFRQTSVKCTHIISMFVILKV